MGGDNSTQVIRLGEARRQLSEIMDFQVTCQDTRMASKVTYRDRIMAYQVTCQDTVITPIKKHAVYIWIELTPKANAKEIVQKIKLQELINQANHNTEHEVIAGVGFGPNFYKQIGGQVKEDYTYAYRRGEFGELPSSAGDVFIHAKSDHQGNLFELTRQIMKALPKDSVKTFEDIYGFQVTHNGNSENRDLSGFIDGTNNPKGDADRTDVAVEKETGGSYVLTQKWIHNFDEVDRPDVFVLEAWLGRKRDHGEELSSIPTAAHIARMRGDTSEPKFKIVRQSTPFGTLSGGAGLFFLAYSASPKNLNFMLDNMVGSGVDSTNDLLMLMTENVKGTYWYFPGKEELAKLQKTK